MGRLLAYAGLFRLEHAVMLCVAVALSILLSSQALGRPLPPAEVLIAALLVPAFIEMASFSLNDYFDVESDRTNKRTDRPLAFGGIPPSHALAASAACYILGIALSFLLPPSAFFIAVLFALLSIAYNAWLKQTLLVGNFYIALSMAIPFLFGNIVVSDAVLPQIWGIFAVALVAGLGREIAKSAEDVEGDVLHRKAFTLPAAIGKKRALMASAFLYALLVPLSLAPFALGLRANTLSVGLVLLSSFSFAAMAHALWSDQSKERLASLRKASLLSLAVGLLGYSASLL